MNVLKVFGKILIVIGLGIMGMIIGAIFGAFGYASIGIPKKKFKKERKREPFEGI